MIWRCVCGFWIFDWRIFDRVKPLKNLGIVPTTPPRSFIGFIWYYADCLTMIWRCTCGLGFLLVYFWQNYALLQLWCPSVQHLVLATRPTSFIGNYAGCFTMIWRCAHGFGFSIGIFILPAYEVCRWVYCFQSVPVCVCVSTIWIVYLVGATPMVFNRFIWNLVGFFGIVWRCAFRFVNFLHEIFCKLCPFVDRFLSCMQSYICTWWAQLLLGLSINLFETWYVSVAWSEDAHIVLWTSCAKYFASYVFCRLRFL